jgi:uncharacterized protein (DUF2141 family)
MMVRAFNLLACAGFAGIVSMPISATAADLTVVVENVKSAEGKVRIGLFNKAEGFPKAVLVGQAAEAKPGPVTFVFKDLAPGAYAVSAYHDINDNKKLDTSFVGMPTEPYGFSGNARAAFGPPKFDEARLALDDKGQRISIELK